MLLGGGKYMAHYIKFAERRFCHIIACVLDSVLSSQEHKDLEKKSVEFEK